MYFWKVLQMILMYSLDEELLLKTLCSEVGMASVASLVPPLPASLFPLPPATMVPECQHALPLSLPEL